MRCCNIRYDPAGFIMEHYVDGDLVDSTQAPHRSQASPDGLHVWGKFFSISILHISRPDTDCSH